MKRKIAAVLAATLLALTRASAADKAKAYELYEQKHFEEAAEQFRLYVKENPDDAQAAFDYANLLAQLNRHADAAKIFESLYQKNPKNESAYFKLGVVNVQLKRFAEAEKVFSALEQSANADMARSATEAKKQLQADMARAEQQRAEDRIFELARSAKHQDVIAAVNALEKQGEPPFSVLMQRVYAWQSLHQYAQALDHANKLAALYPNMTDVAFVRADLLAQLGRGLEAKPILDKLQKDYAGTAIAAEAGKRLQGGAPGSAAAEDKVFDLARKGRHRDVVTAIDELEKQGTLSWTMELQRLYALQAAGDSARALARANQLSEAHPHATDLAFLRADLLVHAGQYQAAAQVLKPIKQDKAGTTEGAEAARRLESMPPMANLDKHWWGEAYLSGDYLGRFGAVVGSGFVREGAYVPGARWLQPYAEFRFSVDTKSGVGAVSSIVSDNSTGLNLGVRAQPWATESVFLYASAGINKDLLSRRNNGDWREDFQIGVNAFKSWGPGTVLLSFSEADHDATLKKHPHYPFVWRGDWFVDAGADFSYYYRFSSAIGYGQAHEGFRLAQFGKSVAWDAYAVQNVAFDVRGNYFDNALEVGPGTRLVWHPCRHTEVVLRAEWLNGYYFGRDELRSRGGQHGQYDEARIGLSVGVRW